MLRFSIAINTLLQEYTIYDRIKIAADLGYDGVDVYDDHMEYDPVQLRKTAEENNIPVVSSGLNDAFFQTLNLSYDKIMPVVSEALHFASEAGASSICALGGRIASPQDQPKNIIIENLKRLSELAEKAGVNLMLEPVNNIMEHRDMYLCSSVLGFEIVKCVNSDYVKLLYDFYHMQVNEGNILHNLINNLDLVHHLHVSGIPNHDEPMYCEIDYPYVLNGLEEAGYKEFVGLEYGPSFDSITSMKDSLAYLKSYQ